MRLPEVLAGAAREPGQPEQVRYLLPGAQFGIDISEIEDLGPGMTTAASAMAGLTRMLEQPRSCASAPSRCVRGSDDEGSLVVLWGHDRSPLVFAAVAPDEPRLQALLRAWAQ